VIILPPGAAIPAPGTPGIPENAVFMAQDPATGALIPLGAAPPGPAGPPAPHLLPAGLFGVCPDELLIAAVAVGMQAYWLEGPLLFCGYGCLVHINANICHVASDVLGFQDNF
jgi:hypothetical protein